MQGLVFRHAGSYSAPRGHHFPPHKHSCWEVVLYREGRIEVPTGDEVFTTRAGLILLTPPDIVHEERALTAYSNFYITVDAPADHRWPRVASDDAGGTCLFYAARWRPNVLCSTPRPKNPEKCSICCWRNSISCCAA